MKQDPLYYFLIVNIQYQLGNLILSSNLKTIKSSFGKTTISDDCNTNAG